MSMCADLQHLWREGRVPRRYVAAVKTSKSQQESSNEITRRGPKHRVTVVSRPLSKCTLKNNRQIIKDISLFCSAQVEQVKKCSYLGQSTLDEWTQVLASLQFNL